MAAVSKLIDRFRQDVSGNMAVLFALAMLPMLSAVGCAVDYAQASAIRVKLLAAADAASVGSVAKTSPGFMAAGAMLLPGPVQAGIDDAKNIFNALAGAGNYTLDTVSASVTKSLNAVDSKVSFSATMPTTFMGAVGFKAMTITGSSTASATTPQYIDFYLLLDNSPSMGVGATPTDVDKMVNNTSDKCAFACHDTANANNYYKKAKDLGVTTRIDVLRSATQQLMDTAAATQTYSTQFRMAIYDFGASAQSAGLRSLFSLSSSLSSAKTAAGNIDLMTVNGQNDNGDQDTAFTSVLPAINQAISAPGTGTALAPLKYVFFVSDGVADEYNPGGCKKPTTNGRCQSPLNPTLCQNLKDRGIKVAVLYTTYLALPTNGWYNQWISPFNAGPYGPSVNSEIASNMQSCASPGFYFEVSPTQGIAQAMNALFQKAVSNARITS